MSRPVLTSSSSILACSALALALSACAADQPARATDERPAEAVRGARTRPLATEERTEARTGEPAKAAPTGDARAADERAFESGGEKSDETARATPTDPSSSGVRTDEDALRPSANDETDPREKLKREAVRLIESGELARARAVIDELLTEPAIAQARALLDAKRPKEALAILEEVLDDAPGEPRTLLAHGEACLQTGFVTRESAHFESALASFLRSGDGAAARFGASRAARWLGRYEEAAQLAREGWNALGPGPAMARTASGEAPERTLAEAEWAWFESLPAPDAESAPREYIDAGERVIASGRQLLAREPADVTTWLRVASAQRKLGRSDDEVRTLEEALDFAPASERVAEQLSEAAMLRGGLSDVIAVAERARSQHPANPVLWRASAQARFERAFEARDVEAVQHLKLADAEFERWAALANHHRTHALRSRALCRAAAGWMQLDAGSLDAAIAEFRSVQALGPGAANWSLEGRTASALDGLVSCANILEERGAMGEAARIWNDLHKGSPEVVEWAVRAGRAWRSAAERELVLSKELKLAADGRITEPAALEELRKRARIGAKPRHGVTWTLALQRASTESAERAGKLFKNSYSAFVDAAQLAPNDVRVLCDAAEVAVYELKQDLPVVQEFLKEAIRLGDQRRKEEGLPAEERRAVLEALGDAHECMGVLLLEYKREPARAKQSFLRSVEIGPDPRPIVTETYLPQCEEELRSKLR